MTGYMIKMSSISQRKNELFKESRRLTKAIFLESNKKGNKKDRFEKTIKLRKQEDEVWKRKMFFENYLKQLEKENRNGKN